jgi:hypothetical protein
MNREKLLETRRAYNKKWRESEHGREFDKERNASPERREYRKKYKQTEAGKRSNNKYRNKPEVKEKIKDRRLQIRYGITMAEYWNMVAVQGGVCAICMKPDGKKLHVDHDHKSGKIRGLLCGNCNKALGLFKDDTKILVTALSYLNGQVSKNDSTN